MPGKEMAEVPPETAEKGSEKLDAKPYSTATQKKMKQARLPFKRLNPAHSDKDAKIQREISNMVQKDSSGNMECSIDDVENGCKMETEEVQTVPKINGWGPLDNYIQKISKARSVIPDTIDLTEDSNSGHVEILPSNEKEQLSSVNGTDLLSCDLVRTPLVQTNKDQEDGDVSTVLASSDGFSAEEVTDKEQAEDEDTLSSNTSPVSSPDGLTSTMLKGAHKSTPSTGRCKEKEHVKKIKLQAEKEERDRIREELKLAKERAKEEAKKKKDEEKEQKAKEKKEKKEKDDQERAEKMRLKEERKKEKLDALEAKQEEKRKKEEEKRIKEEEKRMKAEKAEITRFLQRSKNTPTTKTFAQSCGKFAPFEIKKNMAVAPLCRVVFEMENSEQLGQLIKEQNSKLNYLLELKTRKPRSMGRTVIPRVPLISDTDEVQVVIETDSTVHEEVAHERALPERRKFGKMKLLQFCENYRPAYWGTWNRSSEVICPRKPWAQDSILLDYDVDSDEEWEEDEPGESLSHSEGDEDEDPKEEEEEDDDGFFVPHGYLSEDEGGVSDEECKNPENQKVRQRLKAKEWDELQSKGKKINVLKPILIGCVWLGGSTSGISFLQKFSTCVFDTVNPIEEEMAQECNSSRRLEDREILMHLLPLLHGNVNGSKIIIQEFQECCRRGNILLCDGSNTSATESSSPNAFHQTPGSSNIPSKARLKRIISENSVYEKRPDHRLCWYVHNDVLKSFQQESLPVPCQWTYVTQVNLHSRDEILNTTGQATPPSKRKSAGSMPITKFMRKASVIGSSPNMALDGFQADTEDDDDEDDCMIVEEQVKKDMDVPVLCTMEGTFSQQLLSNPEISRGSN
ncbi:chromatin assembly factor 1 subunit A [Pyxicephalus adspersus]|uniref:Chromatin assembly factor 1 subunit A n=1 Tax=Pyxicephalus adspersus TaxID=30357 RepID=A0AAV3AVD9_PYXAD|nr:TPA: hypothetical protein GDO54_008879 [Pyxicephalus adspersus]